MISPNTPVILTRRSQEALLMYLKQCRDIQVRTLNLREQFRLIDLNYMRENDLTSENWRAKIANRYGDSDKFQNITVPIVAPQVEAAVTYQASVFLTGNPIFGVVSDPQNIDAAIQMETVIDDQAIKGGWVNQFMLAFRDAFKYNFYALECSWDRIVTANLETDITFDTKQAKPVETIWEGNVIRRIDPYNVLMDLRVKPSEIHSKGEYVGYTELMSRIQLKAYIASLPNKIVSNVVTAFESGLGTGGISSDSSTASYYIPQLNPDSSLIKDIAREGFMNWLAWAGIAGNTDNINYRDVYQVTTLYAKILPGEFNMPVPKKNTPQIWKFIIVNDSVIIYAERQTNAHGFLPILCGQGMDDGLGYQTKSLATNVTPLQQLSSAMWNSIIASRRRAISDRTLYDPSRVSEAHINNPNPAAKIPVRPAAYGKPIAESVFQFPFRDDQSPLLAQEAAQIEAMANKVSRQNPVRQGQFVKGNKTKQEFQDVMMNANGGDQMIAMAFESYLFTPLKEIIKLNILQYQGGVSLFNREKEQLVDVDPLALRQAVLNFKVSDGLVPSDKLISADAMRDAFQALASIPALGSQYNLGPLFSYLIKLSGAKIESFQKSPEQVAYEQAVAQWQQVVEMILKTDPTKELPPQPMPQQFGYNPNPQGQVTNGNPSATSNQLQ